MAVVFKRKYPEDEDEEVSCLSKKWRISASANNLPNEILLCIFSYLGLKDRIRLQFVCHRWYCLCRFWPAKFFLFNRPFPLKTRSGFVQNDHMIPSLLSRCGVELRSLIIMEDKKTDGLYETEIFSLVAKYCPNIVELYLISVFLYNATKLFQGLQKLKVLKIDMVRKGQEVNDEILALCKSLEQLELRTFTCHKDVTNTWLTTGVKICFSGISKNMRILEMNDCCNLESVAMKNLVHRCHGIQNLELRHCKKIDQKTMQNVLQHYRHSLTVLRLDYFSKQVNWSRVIAELPTLEELSLFRCRDIYDDVCLNLAGNCPGLKMLNIGSTNITDVGLQHLAQLKNLTELHIGSNASIIGEGIASLARIRRLEKLAAFDLENLKNGDDCFSELAQSCPSLKFLDVGGNEVSNDLIHAFRAAVNVGRVKGPIRIEVLETSVDRDVEVCAGLKVTFGNYQEEESAEGEDEKWEAFTFTGPHHKYQFLLDDRNSKNILL